GGDFIFKLYDTFGFPVDIVRDISLERGVGFDEDGFQQAMDAQRAQSRASRKGDGVQLKSDGGKSLIDSGRQSDFIGYTALKSSATVLGLLDSAGAATSTLAAGEQGKLFVDSTPFYAEAGGQVGDVGTVTWEHGSASVLTTTPEADGIILHGIRIEQGTLSEGMAVSLEVAVDRRGDTAANHTATHLLHAALRNSLGDHVKQAGSLVSEDRLRFDFTHFSALSEAEKNIIEVWVNDRIRENFEIDTKILSKDEALKQGATALFGEKYGESVRVVSIAGISKELCGGTHVSATGTIGLFKIISESGIASGVRRIEALTGRQALQHTQAIADREAEISRMLNVPAGEIMTKLASLQQQQKMLEKQVAGLSTQLASSDLEQIFKSSRDVGGIPVIAAKIPLDSPKTLREVGDRVRDNMGSGVAVLGGEIKGKAALLVLVSKDLTDRLNAGKLVNKAAGYVGGKGGGRADMAQAGGPFADKVPEAISAVPAIVETFLKS
ncbi:MAG: alanine--tRNA ligase-related protein, partial [Desulfocapsaceae bacterium]|nr:alanine--tRNA ligase-related protein [Desulfocapsaceae bacterium]